MVMTQQQARPAPKRRGAKTSHNASAAVAQRTDPNSMTIEASEMTVKEATAAASQIATEDLEPASDYKPTKDGKLLAKARCWYPGQSDATRKPACGSDLFKVCGTTDAKKIVATMREEAETEARIEERKGAISAKKAFLDKANGQLSLDFRKLLAY